MYSQRICQYTVSKSDHTIVTNNFCATIYIYSDFLFGYHICLLVCRHLTPASCEWSQLWIPIPPWTQSMSLDSVLSQRRSSSKISPVPLTTFIPVKILTCAVQNVRELRCHHHMHMHTSCENKGPTQDWNHLMTNCSRSILYLKFIVKSIL